MTTIVTQGNLPRILVLDIEASPIDASVWKAGMTHVSPAAVKKDWNILAFSAKWLGDEDDKVIYADLRKGDVANDLPLLNQIHKLLDECDAVVAHNGARFDLPKINARFILNQMSPPSPFKVIDTLALARKHFKFTSNTLAFLTENLCVKHKKTAHGKFPGMTLWTECLNGNQKAWAEMKKYNIKDTLALEELYLILRGWVNSSFNVSNYTSTDDRPACPKCGSGKMQSRGVSRTQVGVFQRFQCQDCSGWSKGRTNLQKTGKSILSNATS